MELAKVVEAALALDDNDRRELVFRVQQTVPDDWPDGFESARRSLSGRSGIVAVKRP